MSPKPPALKASGADHWRGASSGDHRERLARALGANNARFSLGTRALLRLPLWLGLNTSASLGDLCESHQRSYSQSIRQTQ